MIRSLHMKIELNWANGLWENYVLICWWDSNMSNFAWKVNLDLWNLFIDIVSIIRLKISRENNDYKASTTKKNEFSKMFPFKCILKQIWPWC